MSSRPGKWSPTEATPTFLSSRHLSGGVHERAEIQGVRRSERDVTIAFRDRPPMVFDEVVFACHGDQVLPLLASAS